MSSFNEDTEQKILKAFSLLIATVHFKQSKFSDIIDKSEIIKDYLSGNRDLSEKDYEELDKP